MMTRHTHYIGFLMKYQMQSTTRHELEKEDTFSFEFDVLDVLNTLRLEPYLTNEDQRIIIKRMLKCSSLYGNVSCSDGGTV